MHFLCKCNRNPPFMPFYPFARQNTRRSHTAGEQALSAKGGRLRRAFRLSFGRDFLGYFSVFCRLRQGWRVRGALRRAGWWRGVSVVARRGEVPLAGCSGGCFQRFTPRGALAAARRDGALLVSGPGNRFFRAAPRGGAGGCVAERSSAGGLQRRVFSPLCAARGAALARGPRGAAAAFLASLTRR